MGSASEAIIIGGQCFAFSQIAPCFKSKTGFLG